MIATKRHLTLTLCGLMLAACTQQPGEISRDTKPFDGIAPTASITVGGTEPFWGLSVEPQGEGYEASYSSPENIEGTAFPVTRFAGNNGVGYSGEIDGQAVHLALTPGACSDGMSDRTYPYSATLALGERTLFGCAHTSDEPFTGEEMP